MNLIKLLETRILLLILLIFTAPKLGFGEPKNNIESIPYDYRGIWESVGVDDHKHLEEFGCAMQIIIGRRSINYIRSEDWEKISPSIVGINYERARERLFFGWTKPTLKVKYGSGFGADYFRSVTSDWTSLVLEDTYLLLARCPGCDLYQKFAKAR